MVAVSAVRQWCISAIRLSELLGLLVIGSAVAMAQTAQPGIYHEPETRLTLRYPVELVVRDAKTAVDEGHIAVFGSLQNHLKEHELAGRCLTPLLLAELPAAPVRADSPSTESAATMMMFEFMLTKECRDEFKYKDTEKVAGGIAQAATQLPGATPLSPPLWYALGKQKLHATFAALDLKNSSPDKVPSLIVMAAMQYHGNILCWLMSAAKLDTFNELTKSSVEFDDGKVCPLVPFNLDDHLHLPINIVK